MKRRTKIVCTLGPSTATKADLKALIDAGMNVARLNCSHGDWDTRRQWISWIRELSGEMSPIAVLVDLQGPKFRIGILPGDRLDVKAGDVVEVGPGPGAHIPIMQPEIVAAFAPNTRLLLGDGDVEIRLTAQKEDNFVGKVYSSGQVRTRQGVTIVGRVFDVPCVTPKDLEDMKEACAAGADYIALSYVRHADDLRDLRGRVDKLDKEIGIIAKIETKQGINEIDEILKVADAIMVARGDMGLQIPIEEVPLMQKRLIDRCTAAGKPVITATQMLESMVHSPRPTRAETTDVANAILDGTDAVMLSGETASGEYPAECVKMMANIAEKAEGLYDFNRIEHRFQERAKHGVTLNEALAYAVNEMASMLKPTAIITTTSSGQTPRIVGKFRPKAQILSATWNRKTHNKLALLWGVESLHVEKPKTTEENMQSAIDAFVAHRRLKKGDVVIITSGVPVGVAGNTNMIVTQTIN